MPTFRPDRSGSRPPDGWFRAGLAPSLPTGLRAAAAVASTAASLETVSSRTRSGMAGMAARFDAMDRNRVRDVGRIESSGSSARALSLEEAQDLRQRIHAAQRAVEWDLVDLTDFMLSTGLRIGETCAVTWDALDLEAAPSRSGARSSASRAQA